MTLLPSEIKRRKDKGNAFLWIGVAASVIGFFSLVGSLGAGAFWTSTLIFGNGEAAQKAVDSMTGSALVGSIFWAVGGSLIAIGWLQLVSKDVETDHGFTSRHRSLGSDFWHQ